MKSITLVNLNTAIFGWKINEHQSSWGTVQCVVDAWRKHDGYQTAANFSCAEKRLEEAGSH